MLNFNEFSNDRKSFVDVSLFAKKIGVSVKTVYRWIDEGRIAGVRIESKLLVYLPSLKIHKVGAWDE